MSACDHLHIYNLRGYCWCGEHRDDWLRNEDILNKIGKAFKKLNEDASKPMRDSGPGELQ